MRQQPASGTNAVLHRRDGSPEPVAHGSNIPDSTGSLNSRPQGVKGAADDRVLCVSVPESGARLERLTFWRALSDPWYMKAYWMGSRTRAVRACEAGSQSQEAIAVKNATRE